MLGAILVIMFIVFVAIGVPISFALGIVSFTGIACMPDIPNTVVFTKMFNGLNSFTLLAVPLFILAANLMNEAGITEKLIECICDLVGHWKGGLAYANVLVSMVFAGISGSSQADTSGVGKIFIPAMEKQGYDKGTSVGVTAASSTLGSIIPPSITMVVFAGISNSSTGALFMSGIVPGILLGIAQMAVIKTFSNKKNFPQSERVPFKTAMKHTLVSMPALLTPIILIGGIVSGLFTPTESAAFACIYALLVGIFFYRSIKISRLPFLLIETMKMASLSLFALATANALGELLSYYRLNVLVQGFFTGLPGGRLIFLLVCVAFFMFVGTFMDAVPAMILFVP
ncbi:MAG: TRAP transporter large permease, partial [Lachnospiraceae bacterium]|nr:TRAP transporter large permease [Lachnospiraceae bacterium]